VTRDEWLDLSTLVAVLFVLWLVIAMVTALRGDRQEQKRSRQSMDDAVQAHREEVVELKKLRLNVFRHFAEWLRTLRGKDKDDEQNVG
jgi:sensor domain CHASE-containing protein